MSKKSPPFKFYVPLDAILDTRLGTIARISEDLAEKALYANYHQRDVDLFDGVDDIAFKEMYAKRDEETLQASTMCGSLLLLRNLCDEISKRSIIDPQYSGPAVDVNFYPYNLPADLTDMILNAIRAWVGTDVPLVAISSPDKELTIEHMKKNYQLIVMYEYENWLNMHIAEFETIRMPEVSIFVPAIYFSKKPTEQEMKSLLAEAPHPFESLEIMTKPMFDLNLIDVRFFSIIRQEDIPTLAKISESLKLAETAS